MLTILCIGDISGAPALADLLHRAEYNILFAADARAPLNIVGTTSIHAVLLDCHQLSEPPGNLATALRMVLPDVPLLMMSNHCSVPCARQRQADACVHKSDPANTLLQILRAVLLASRISLRRSLAT